MAFDAGHGLKKPKNGKALGNLHRITKGFARKNVLAGFFWVVILSKGRFSNILKYVSAMYNHDFKLSMNKYNIVSNPKNNYLVPILT